MSNHRDKGFYRQQQEAFVSNHGGTTSREVVYAIMPNVCSILLAVTTLGLVGKHIHRNVRVLLEFILIVIPSVLCCTVLSEYVITVCFSMILISIMNVAMMGIDLNNLSNFDMRPIQGRRPFLTNFRAQTNMITAICILAIDFQVFPRKFAKTEVFGYSLMDTGVGLFVLANALVAPEARNFDFQRKVGFFSTILKNLRQTIKSCIPLLLLGFGRCLAIEFTGYQKHVTEYGIHWNFFITLAFVKLFTSSITSTVSSRYSLLSGVWILAMHEYILNTKGLKEWVLSKEPRIDFVSSNREGIVSVPGYVGLYLVGVAIGRLIHSTYYNSQRGNPLQYKRNIHVKIFGHEFDACYNESMILCVKLSLITAQACAATLFCDSYFRVSRRLANAGYCMWIITLGTMVLTFLLLVEIITDILAHITSSKEPQVATKRNRLHKGRYKQECVRDECEEGVVKRNLEICEAVNFNGLFFFLLANLMTGAINMLMFTLYVNRLQAMLVLIGYMFLNFAPVVILHRYRIQFRL